ncbi:unnamed protein product [Rotaria sp. Silwood1]|nr:unnamed protein product [Rotaria sp. Silwood1]CAF3487742.1 unnamed protein product [Rotaria sp. Silwood1]CAF3522786.1 unnamed protein product [Rotaria sp. Silwood1]CAF3545119.1 unnamed protein product [Rotaria sp. Silwood1]CAF4819042.1 unnamed protein product [Rotaria sp. Silwood1]
MQALILSIVFIFLILLCVPAGSIENNEPASKVSRKNIVELPSYSKLLTLLKNRERKFYQDDADDSSSSQNDDDDSNSNQKDNDMPHKREQLTSENRRFFMFPGQQSSGHRNRPPPTYGRRPHWDTFFG